MVGINRNGWWVISRIKTFLGGSSNIFKRALAAELFISSAASIIATLQPPSVADILKKFFNFRISSTVIFCLNFFNFSSHIRLTK